MLLRFKFLVLFFGVLFMNSCLYNKAEQINVGPGSGPLVDFNSEIKPILIKNCLECHSDTATNPKKPGYALFLKGGNDFSEFQRYATTPSSANAAYTKVSARLRGIESPAMPFERTPLHDSSITKIERWVMQGARLN